MRLRTWLIDVIPALIVALAIIGWAYPRFGTWAGYWFPAAAPMALTSAARTGDLIVFGGTSARLRPQCNPRRLEWYLGERQGRSTPVVVNWGPPEIKPDDVFTFEGWTAEMTDVEAFRFQTFSDVLHRCRVLGIELPFDVRTRFYR